MPRKPKSTKPLYRQKPPKKAGDDFVRAEIISPAHFEFREDGTITVERREEKHAPSLAFRDDARGLWLYHGNCLELLDAIAAKYPEGRFDCIFADPPYFLSNGGISCHAGKMVSVHKGDWDQSRGPELNHEFNTEWLRRCQRVLKPNGTIWVSGTLHVIHSIGFAMQQLGFRILNEITWEKPNPPPNLGCRCFTHSTETVLWAAKSEKSKHTFNYDLMRQTNGGKQMKTVWTMTAPGGEEKRFGKHPTQKPIALVERCLLASTNKGDMILDPFSGGGVEHNCRYSKWSKRRRHRAGRAARQARCAANRGRNRKDEGRAFQMNDAPWKVIAEKTGLLQHNFKKGAFHLTAEQIKTATHHFTTTNEREVRCLCKQDTRESRPQVFRENGLFLLPTKNKFYAVVQGEGYVDIPIIKSQPVAYQSKLDFRLETSEVGDSEMQHLDFAYASSLVRTFLDDPSLVLTVRGRKYTPHFSFRVGKTNLTAESVQTEVDAGYEGRNQVALVEAKRSKNTNTIIRQLYFPFRQWQEHTKKPVVTIFFQREGQEFSLWEFRFPDVADYNSIQLVRSQRFTILAP